MPMVVAAGIAYGLQAVGIATLAFEGAIIAAGYIITGAAVYYASKSMQKQPSFGSLTSEATGRMQLTRDTVTSRRVVYGLLRVSGPLLFGSTTSNDSQLKNENLHLIIGLAGHKCGSLRGIYLGENRAVDEYGNILYPYNGKFRYLFRDGDPDQTAFSFADSAWTSEHRLRGICALYVKLGFDPATYPNGIPNVTAVIEGYSVPDMDDNLIPACSNPALILRHYLKTYFKAEDSEIDDDSFRTATNICDEEPFGDGRKRYSCNYSFTLNQKASKVIEDILRTMYGKLSYVNGKFRVKAGAYQTPVMTLNEDDILDGLSITTKASSASTFNAVKGIFVDGGSYTSSYKPADFVAVTSSYYQAEDDGEQKFNDIELSGTTDHTQARRLAKLSLLDSRQDLVISFPAKLRARRLIPGDTVYLDLQRYGWDHKVFEVTELTVSPELKVSLTLKETAAEIYDFPVDEDVDRDLSPNSNLPDPFTVNAPSGFTATETTTTDKDGTIFPSVTLNWNAYSTGSSVADIELDFKESAGTGSYTVLGRFSNDVNSFTTLDVEADKAYTFRARHFNYLGNCSNYVSASLTVVGDRTPPNTPQSIVATGGSGSFSLTWTNDTADKDYAYTKIFFNSANSLGTATFVGGVSGTTWSRVVAQSGSYYGWLQNVDTSGNQSATSSVATAYVTSIAGTAGPAGPAGPSGSVGPAGPSGSNGANGDYVQRRYLRSDLIPATPTGDNPAGWTITPPLDNGQPLWVSEATRSGVTNAVIGSWSTPVRLSGMINFYQTTPPTTASFSINAGDLWWDTSNGNEVYRWNGANWISVQDANIPSIQTQVTTLSGSLVSTNGVIVSNSASLATSITGIGTNLTSASASLAATIDATRVSLINNIGSATASLSASLAAGIDASRVSATNNLNAATASLSASIAQNSASFNTTIVALSNRVTADSSSIAASITSTNGAVTSTSSSLAATINTLSTRVTSDSASLASSITSTQGSVTTASSSLAASITSLSSTVNTNSASLAASISATNTTVVNNSSSFAGSLNTVQSTFNTNLGSVSASLAATITSVKTSDTNNSASAATALSQVSSSFATTTAATNASVSTLNGTVTTNSASLATALTQVSSSFATTTTATNASVSTLSSTVTTNSASAATSLNQVSSSFAGSLGTTNANVSSLSGTVTSNSSSIATRVDGLQSTVTANSSSLAASITTTQASVTSVSSSAATARTQLSSSFASTTGTLNSSITTLSGTVTTNSSSAAARADTLQTNINTVNTSLGSSITTLSGTVTTNSSSAASRADTLQSNINSVNSTLGSSISSLSGTVTTNSSSAATRMDGLQSSITGNSSSLAASITTLQTTITSVSSSAATARTQLSSSFATTTGNLNSSITSLSSTVTTNSSSAATRADTLQTNINTVNTSLGSSITTLQGTVTTNSSSIATRVDGLQSTVTANSASLASSITSTNTSLANASSSLAGRMTTTEANVTNNSSSLSSRVLNVETTYATKTYTQTTATSSISSAVSSANTYTNGQISSLSSVYATPSYVQSTATSTVSAQITSSLNPGGIVSGSVSTVAKSVATLSGSVASEYVLNVTSGNRVAGFRLTNAGGGGGGSNFVVQCDKFQVVDTSGGASRTPFTVTGGVVYIDDAVIRTVAAGKITAGTVSAAVSLTAAELIGARITGSAYMVNSRVGMRYQDDSGVLTITGGSDNGNVHGAQIDLAGNSAVGAYGALSLSAGQGTNSTINFLTNNADNSKGVLRAYIDTYGVFRTTRQTSLGGSITSGAGNIECAGSLSVGTTATTGTTGQIDATGAVNASSFNASSARRLKTNIRPLDGALEKVLKLDGVIFDRKDGSKKEEIGFIADDVLKVVPAVVSKDSYGEVAGVDYSRLTALLVEAVKAQQATIQKLEARVAKLEKRKA